MKNKTAFILLRNIDLLCKNKAGNQDQSRLISYFGDLFRQTQKGLSCILVATARKKSSLPEKLASFFPHTLCMDALDDDSRLNVILYWKRVCQSSKEWNTDSLVRQSGGWKLTDFSLLFAEAKLESFQRLGKTGIDADDADLQKAMGCIRKKRGAAFGFPKVPDVEWSDIGGLERVKKEIMDTIELPLRHPELFPEDLQRSGLLLFGPPGTGKTLLAKAVARQCSLNFISVKGPEILNMYVGQSEENLREIFARARRAAPCVIFFDELDSIAPNRGRSGQSGGVMDSVVAQLLAELDGIQKNSRVFVIGATNRPDLLDPSLLRPGRFDKQINVGISKTKEEQIFIVTALTRKFNMAPDVSLEEIVNKCPMNFSGADFYALCSNAMMNSVRKMIQSEEASSGIVISQDDFIKALAQVNRSLE